MIYLHAVKNKSNLAKILLPAIACPLLLAFAAFLWTCKYRGTNNKQPLFSKCIVLELVLKKIH